MGFTFLVLVLGFFFSFFSVIYQLSLSSWVGQSIIRREFRSGVGLTKSFWVCRERHLLGICLSRPLQNLKMQVTSVECGGKSWWYITLRVWLGLTLFPVLPQHLATDSFAMYSTQLSTFGEDLQLWKIDTRDYNRNPMFRRHDWFSGVVWFDWVNGGITVDDMWI